MIEYDRAYDRGIDQVLLFCMFVDLAGEVHKHAKKNEVNISPS